MSKLTENIQSIGLCSQCGEQTKTTSEKLKHGEVLKKIADILSKKELDEMVKDEFFNNRVE